MTKVRQGRGGIVGVVLVLGGLSGPALVAQSSLRGFGHSRFDTEAYALPALDLAAADNRTIVLRADGRIFVHGDSQLGDAPQPPVGATPMRVALGGDLYTGENGFALLSDGSIMTWGANGGLPAPVLPTGTNYVQLAAGYRHALALRSDGVAVAWGDNSFGQTSVPALPPGVAVQQVYAASNWSLLLLSNGTLVAFGYSSQGQTSVPALPPGLTYTAAWIGPAHAIARRSDGAFVTWGDNRSGQGNLPALPPVTTWTTFGLGQYHTVAARSDGAVLAFGDNSYGQCDVPALPGGIVAQIVGGGLHSLVRYANGSVSGWGGYGGAALPTPVLPPGERWIDVATGYAAYGLTSSGQVLPIGDQRPVPALPPGFTYTAVIAGGGHAVALRSDGRAFAWGDNIQGECAIPTLPPGMTYTDADAAFGRTVLLRSDGAAAQCGSYGSWTFTPATGTRYVQASCDELQALLLRSDDEVLLAASGTPQLDTPPALPPGLHYTSVAAARLFRAALRSDGEIVVWAGSAHLPMLPAGVVYVQIDGGQDLLAARRSDGRVVVIEGVNGTPVDAPVPGPGESFVDVSMGYGGAVRVGPTSTYTTFASGCGGSRAPSRLVPIDTPSIGRALEVHLFDLPQDVAVMVFGWQRTAPIPLAPLGLPGCMQHVSLDQVTLLLGQNGQALYRLPIANQLALVGLAFRNQAIVFNSSANAAGAVVSDAAEGVIGQH